MKYAKIRRTAPRINLFFSLDPIIYSKLSIFSIILVFELVFIILFEQIYDRFL